MQLNLLRNAVHPAAQPQPSKPKTEIKCPACKGALVREGKRSMVLSCFHVSSVQGGARQGGQAEYGPELLSQGLCEVLREHTYVRVLGAALLPDLPRDWSAHPLIEQAGSHQQIATPKLILFF
jgi:hypothetical protein